MVAVWTSPSEPNPSGSTQQPANPRAPSESGPSSCHPPKKKIGGYPAQTRASSPREPPSRGRSMNPSATRTLLPESPSQHPPNLKKLRRHREGCHFWRIRQARGPTPPLFSLVGCTAVEHGAGRTITVCFLSV